MKISYIPGPTFSSGSTNEYTMGMREVNYQPQEIQYASNLPAQIVWAWIWVVIIVKNQNPISSFPPPLLS